MDYTEINGNLIRNHLLNLLTLERNPGKVLDGNVEWTIPKSGSINTLRTNEEFLRQYHYLIIASEWTGLVYAEPSKFAPKERKNAFTREQLSTEEDTSLIKRVLDNELKQVNVLIAVVAWLSTDGFDWRHIDESIPDISYGFVTTNPRFILPFAAFCSGLGRNKIRSKIFTKEVENNIALKAAQMALSGKR